MKRVCGLFVFIIFLMVSCKTETVYVSYNSNGADFTVMNMTTGEAIYNVGATNMLPNLNAEYGDVIKLSYCPPEKYEHSVFQVVFKAFGKDYQVVTEPFESIITLNSDVALGEYQIYCEATTGDWLDGSSDHGIVQITVGEAKNDNQ